MKRLASITTDDLRALAGPSIHVRSDGSLDAVKITAEARKLIVAELTRRGVTL